MSDVLPSGWIELPLEKCTDILDSKRIPINNAERERLIKKLTSEEFIPYYGATGQVGYINDYIFNEELVLLGEDGVSFYDPYKFKAYKIKGKSWVNNHAHVLKAREGISTNTYICHYLNQFNYQGYITGSTRLKLNQSRMKEIPVRLAPYEEQKRIAGKLEQLLTAVDATKKRLAKVPTILKRFRQSVLTAAVSGELTKDWREGNDISSWEKLPLEKLIKGKPRNGYSPRAVSYETDIKSLTLTATTSGVFNPVHFKYIDTKISDDSHLWLEDGDILIQRGNTLEYVGVSAIYRGPKKAFIYPDLMMKVKTQDNILVRYLHYSLLSEPVRDYFRNNATGTAGNMPKINQKVVMSAPISVPPLNEQQEIVSRVNTLFALADQILEKQKNAQQKTIKLRSSILAKAFRGELVPQDPEDEPADKLLERIKKLPVIPSRKRRSSKKTTISTQRTAMLVTSVSNLEELIAVLGSKEMTADRLIVKSGLSENEKNVDLFYELLREGRDTKRLDVPVGQNLPIRLIHNANR